MSASAAPALDAIAWQLAHSLQAYISDVERLLHSTSPPEAGLYQALGWRMDNMRMYAAALPSMSVAWVEVMIRHCELTHGFWRVQRGEAVDLHKLHEAQCAAVERLYRQCMLLLGTA